MILSGLIVLGNTGFANSFEDNSDFGGSPPDMFGGPQAGALAPNFQLKSLDGQIVSLQDYLGKKPVVLQLGCLTCPIFRQKFPATESLRAKYSGRADFLLLYTIEAHPQGDPSPYSGSEWVTPPNEAEGILYRQPIAESERALIANNARIFLSIRMPILLDDMQNSVWQSYGRAPNAAYLIGSDGRIKLRQGWFEPTEMDKALQKELNK